MLKMMIQVEGDTVVDLAAKLRETANALLGEAKSSIAVMSDSEAIKTAESVAKTLGKKSKGVKAVKAAAPEVPEIDDEQFELGDENEVEEDLVDDEDDVDSDDESDDEDYEDETEEAASSTKDTPKLSLKEDVVPAFQKYLLKQKKKHKGDAKKAYADAKKILAKFKVSKVQDLKPKQYAEALNAIS